MGIIGILVSVLLVSGCTNSSTNQTKTFSDGVMSFNYPAGFNNVTYSGDTNSSSPMRIIGKVENGNALSIGVGRNISATSPTEVRDRSVLKVKNMSTGEVLSITTETNPNGVVVEKTTYTYEVSIGIRARYEDMYFKINDAVYAISVGGADSDKQQIINTANIVFQSIK